MGRLLWGTITSKFTALETDHLTLQIGDWWSKGYGTGYQVVREGMDAGLLLSPVLMFRLPVSATKKLSNE